MLICGGKAKMWYQDVQGRYQEVTTELEGFSSLDDLFSHAAISWNKGALSYSLNGCLVSDVLMEQQIMSLFWQHTRSPSSSVYIGLVLIGIYSKINLTSPQPCSQPRQHL